MKNNSLKKIIFSLLLFINYSVFSQVNKSLSDVDKVALEKIIVEKYYSNVNIIKDPILLYESRGVAWAGF